MRAPVGKAADALGTATVVGAVYLTWALATYLLEGAGQTLLRPEAEVDRLTYAVVANVLAGTLLPLWALRVLGEQTRAPLRLGRLCTAPCTAISVAAAAALGAFMLVPLWRVGGRRWVCVNVFAQVLPTSIAEVVVCWVLARAAVDAALGGRSAPTFNSMTWLAGAALFGLYHFAHSPPYNHWTTVLVLAGVGLLTGGFFLVTGNVYATVILHSSLATMGMIGSLSEVHRLSELQFPQPLLYATATASVTALVALDALWFRGQPVYEVQTGG